MRFGKKTLIALAAVSMAGAAVSAQAASSLSISSARAGATIDDASDIRGGFILPTLAIIALIVAVVLITGGDDSPASP